jgi:ABC-2 type transport system ATP-binding protein
MTAPLDAPHAPAHAGSHLAIDVRHMDKTYRGGVRALRDVSLRVARGEVFGLLGPNGAGKSTLVKVLMTVVRPGRCDGTLLGSPIGHKSTLARVGYLPENHSFPGYLTGAQTIEHFAALSCAPRRGRRRRAAALLDLVGMTRWADARVRGYSKGMRQRLGIAQALANDPDLVVLDEPSDGVDPLGRREIRAILLEQKRLGRTVLLNSHLLSELEMVCDRVAILVRGEVARQGTLDELTAGQWRYEFELGRADPLPPSLPPAHPGAPAMDRLPGSLVVHSSEPAVIQPIIDALRAAGEEIRSIRRVRPSLEDLYVQAVTDPGTGRALDPGAAPARRRKGARA